MKDYKTHLRKEPMSVLTRCGLDINCIRVPHDIVTERKGLPLAKRLDQVTCKNCLQHLYAPELSR